MLPVSGELEALLEDLADILGLGQVLGEEALEVYQLTVVLLASKRKDWQVILRIQHDSFWMTI